MKRRYTENRESFRRNSGRDFRLFCKVKEKTKKIRLDDLLVERGLTKDRKEAQSLVFSGEVSVNNETIKTPHRLIEKDAEIVLKKKRYVSRGGEKLEGALSDFNLDVRGLICADIGVSTGGFTDCLLKHGAIRVYGFDVGYGILDYSLRKDKRVILFERCNFRNFDVSVIEDKFDLIVMDVSFISVKKIIPNAVKLLKKGGLMLILVKPQFEAKRDEVKKGGLIDEPETINSVLSNIQDFLTSLDLFVVDIKPSRVRGSKGNQEYFLLAKS